MQKLTIPATQSEITEEKLPWSSPTIKKVISQETQYAAGTGTDGGIYTYTSLV